MRLYLTVAHCYLTKTAPKLGELFVVEFVKTWQEQAQANGTSSGNNIHLGLLTKRVMENNPDRYALLTKQKSYHNTILPFLETCEGDTLRLQLLQVLSVAKAFGLEAIKILHKQILDGVNALLCGERQNLNLDLTPLLHTENLHEKNQTSIDQIDEEQKKETTIVVERSPSISVSPPPELDEIPPRFVVEEYIKKEKLLLEQEQELQKQPRELNTEKEYKLEQSDDEKTSVQSKKKEESISKIHEGVACDDCGMLPIIGSRFKCLMCNDYDLCETCEQLGRHDDSHIMIKMNHAYKTLPLEKMFGLNQILEDNNKSLVSSIQHSNHEDSLLNVQSLQMHSAKSLKLDIKSKDMSCHNGKCQSRESKQVESRHGHEDIIEPLLEKPRQKTEIAKDCPANNKDILTKQVIGDATKNLAKGVEKINENEFAAEILDETDLCDVVVNTIVTKKWKLRNCGVRPFNSDCILIFVNGDGLLIHEYNVPHCQPGDCVWVSLTFNAFRTPGVYENFFQLANKKVQFGPLLPVKINIIRKSLLETNSLNQSINASITNVNDDSIKQIQSPIQNKSQIDSSFLYSEQLQMLLDMGFDQQLSRELLLQHQGDLAATLRELVENPQS